MTRQDVAMLRRMWVPCLLAVASCHSDSTEERILSVALDLTPVWEVEAEESLRIGHAGTWEDYSFGSVVGVSVDAAGRYLVADGLAQTIEVFAPSGEHLASFGSKGDGPGQFRTLRGLVSSPRGSVWSWDAGSWRATEWDSGGGVVSDVTFPRDIGALSLVTGGVVDGSIVLSHADITPPRAVRREVTAQTYFVGSLQDGTADSLLSLPFQEMVRLSGFPEGRGGAVFPVPFSSRGVGVASTERLYYSSADRPVVSGYDLKGKKLFDTSLDVRAVPVKQDLMDEWKESQREQFGDIPRAERFIETIEEEAGMASVLPTFRRARVDRLGLGWFQLWASDGAPSTWVIVRPDGEVAATVRLSLAGPLLYIDEGFLLVLVEDELGRESIVRLGLVRGP